MQKQFDIDKQISMFDLESDPVTFAFEVQHLVLHATRQLVKVLVYMCAK